MNAEPEASAASADGYDEVPYLSQAFVQTHPDRLASIARLLGLDPPAVETCRVLELGCAAGGNLLPMAYALPQAQFVGIDLSRAQVDQGCKNIAALGLRNIRVEHASIMDVDANWGEFDYLICHGVFSWVPREVQDKVFEIAAQRLTPQGIAYVSYNTYPGWHLRGNVRHMLGYHVGDGGSAAQRVSRARELLDVFAQLAPAEGGAYAQMLGAEIERLRSAEDWYLFHEELEPENAPLYFHAFVERAAGFGLQYLAEAELGELLDPPLEDGAAQSVARLSQDLVQFEQHVDFLRNRHFRQTLLCKASAVPRRQLSPEILERLYLASGVRPEEGAGVDLAPGVPLSFSLKGKGRGTARDSLTKAALLLLGERWPRGWACDELYAAACKRVGMPHAADQLARQRLMHELFGCLLSGLVELHAMQPACVAQAGEHPLASAWARFESEHNETATNLRHEVIRLVPFSRAVLRLLDGRRTRAQLLDELDAQLAAGTLALPQMSEDQDPVARETPQAQDSQTRRALCAAWLDDTLARLARYALLQA